ncbi:hypothetical protein [Dyella sedimenti]|uniref:hypothetical protein n=1 Tax=Dyella sedimenti TaxID=2919947 RepID=UPI001FAB3059|nr:hypothetical protein [Dyella sedimenti]
MAESSGWALSADQFRQRWNQLTKPVYALSNFAGQKASFSDGVVTYMSNGMITLETDHHQAVGSVCVIAYMAAYGADHDEAHAIVNAAIDDGHSAEASGQGFAGYKTFNGHMMGVTLSPTGKVTCTYLRDKG